MAGLARLEEPHDVVDAWGQAVGVEGADGLGVAALPSCFRDFSGFGDEFLGEPAGGDGFDDAVVDGFTQKHCFVGGGKPHPPGCDGPVDELVAAVLADEARAQFEIPFEGEGIVDYVDAEVGLHRLPRVFVVCVKEDAGAPGFGGAKGLDDGVAFRGVGEQAGDGILEDGELLGDGIVWYHRLQAAVEAGGKPLFPPGKAAAVDGVGEELGEAESQSGHVAAGGGVEGILGKEGDVLCVGCHGRLFIRGLLIRIKPFPHSGEEPRMAKKGDPGANADILAAVAYLAMPISSIAVLLVAGDDKRVRFHAIQSGLLGAVLLVATIPVSIIIGIVALLTLGLGFALFPLYAVVVLAGIAYLMYRTYQGGDVKVPLVWEFAEKHV